MRWRSSSELDDATGRRGRSGPRHRATIGRPRGSYVGPPRSRSSVHDPALRPVVRRGGAWWPAALATSGVRAVLAALPSDAGLEEAVDVAVEHGRGVADLVVGPQVLDHLVRVQDVRAHLVAPAGA